MGKLIATFVSGIAYCLSLTAIVCSTGVEQTIALLLGIGFTLLGAGFFGSFVIEFSNRVKDSTPAVSHPVRRPTPRSRVAAR
ncbi:MAG: hypothetical protein WC713_14430 [Candidatus Methylomirabilota bacterium]